MSSKVVEKRTEDLKTHASQHLLYIFRSMDEIRRSGLGDVTGSIQRLCSLIAEAGAAEMSW